MPFTLLNTAVPLRTRHHSVTNGALRVQFLFLVSLSWLSVFSFPVACYLENYYFGKDGGLSHRRALAHVFGNVKAGSDIHRSTAVPSSWFCPWNAVCSYSHTCEAVPLPPLEVCKAEGTCRGKMGRVSLSHPTLPIFTALRLATDFSVRLQQTLLGFSSDI